MGSCHRIVHVSFSCFPRFSLELDPRSRLGGLGGKVGSACEKLEDIEGGVNVSESFGAGSPRLSRMKGH